RTSWPCWKLTDLSSPVICARTATLEYASAVPTTEISSGMSFRTTGATVTGTAAAPPAPWRGACASLPVHAIEMLIMAAAHVASGQIRRELHMKKTPENEHSFYSGLRSKDGSNRD